MGLFRRKPHDIPQNSEVVRYSFDNLVALKQRVDEEIQARQSTELDAIKAKIAVIASTFGVSIEELLGFRPTIGRARKTRRAAVAKYADPADPGNTWSGRGKQPRWLKQKLDAGAKLHDFAVKTS